MSRCPASPDTMLQLDFGSPNATVAALSKIKPVGLLASRILSKAEVADMLACCQGRDHVFVRLLYAGRKHGALYATSQGVPASREASHRTLCDIHMQRMRSSEASSSQRFATLFVIHHLQLLSLTPG